MAQVIYTRHAREKFEVLKRHGFQVTPRQVEQTVLTPDAVIPQPGGREIAQKQITEQHLLGVVFVESSNTAAPN